MNINNSNQEKVLSDIDKSNNTEMGESMYVVKRTGERE